MLEAKGIWVVNQMTNDGFSSDEITRIFYAPELDEATEDYIIALDEEWETLPKLNSLPGA